MVLGSFSLKAMDVGERNLVRIYLDVARTLRLQQNSVGPRGVLSQRRPESQPLLFWS